MFRWVHSRIYFWYQPCEKQESILSNLERERRHPNILPVELDPLLAKDTLTGKEQQSHC
jgi:hypothetical protein